MCGYGRIPARCKSLLTATEGSSFWHVVIGVSETFSFLGGVVLGVKTSQQPSFRRQV